MKTNSKMAWIYVQKKEFTSLRLSHSCFCMYCASLLMDCGCGNFSVLDLADDTTFELARPTLPPLPPLLLPRTLKPLLNARKG